MAESSATHLEVTRDIVVAILSNPEKQHITTGSADAVAKNVATIFTTVYDAVRTKERY